MCVCVCGRERERERERERFDRCVTPSSTCAASVKESEKVSERERGLGFRFSDFGFRVSGFGILVSAFGFLVSGFMIRIWDSGLVVFHLELLRVVGHRLDGLEHAWWKG